LQALPDTPLLSKSFEGVNLTPHHCKCLRSGCEGSLWLSAALEDGFQFFWSYHFQLRKGARLGFAIGAPAAEMRHVAEAPALHVFISDFDDEFGAERFPFKIFAATPPALAAGHALLG
jgi:hypothetical protein